MSDLRASIRSLRTGVVPEWELRRLSVAYEEFSHQLTALLEPLAQSGECAPLFVRGEWGTGKTHLLSYLKTMATSQGFAHVTVTLNPRSAALNYPQRFYPLMSETVTFAGVRGLRSILRMALQDREIRRAIQAFAETPAAQPIGAALRVICAQYKLSEGSDFGDEAAWDILLGADLAWSSAKRLKAFARIASFTTLLKIVGAHGTVAVFDEAESVDQLFNRLSRTGAYETLAALCCQVGTLCVFGITRRFEACINKDIANLSLFAHSKLAAAFLEGWRAARFRTVEPPKISASDASKLVELVTQTYLEAYPDASTHGDVAESALKQWNANAARNPRRLVRLIIDALDSQRPLSPWAASA